MAENDIEIDAPTLKQRFDAGEVQVVDVREQYEWDAGRLPGEVRHIDLSELTAQAGSISKDQPVVFQCRLGARSLMAAQAFRASGYDAYSMAGGIQLWDDQRRPLIPEGGTVADH